MNEWIEELSDLAAAGERAVLVTVCGVRGSAPREVGAKMIVTDSATFGTIGGGQLEYQSTRVAVDLLGGKDRELRKFPLGSSLGQCCGGVVDILFEPLAPRLPGWLRDLGALHGQREPVVMATPLATVGGSKCLVTATEVYGAHPGDAAASVIATARATLTTTATVCEDDVLYEPIVASDFNIAVFGAGHVGTAVVASLAGLDCNIRWIDSRPKMFRKVPANVRVIDAAEPALEVAAMPPGSFYLVMTHSHALDFDVCDRILRREDARYVGLIGSRSKRRRFEKRYRQQGMAAPVLAQLTCPIGVDGISGKKPAEIAVAAAAQILKVREQRVQGAVIEFDDNVRPLRS